jgi:ribulose-5-phosphate 4-epimerase/fuculose-1-phosphate aldolase
MPALASFCAPIMTGTLPDMNDDPAVQGLRDDLALANRILVRQGVLDAFGHVSVRHPTRADRFLLARNMAPASVTPDDILEFDLDGAPVAAAGPKPYLERFIHGEILRARSDVTAVVHSHSPAVIPFSVVKSVPLRAVSHMGSFLGEITPVFEIREHAGDASDLLIRDNALGRALAASLGPGPAVLMRGHGITVVARSLREAVFRAVYAEFNARIESDAMKLGPVMFLTAAEAGASAATNASQVDRAWDVWKQQVQGGAGSAMS